MKILSSLNSRLYICILTIFSLIPAAAVPANLDSLAAIYKDAAKPDSVREKAFNNLVVSKLFTDPAGTMSYINEFLEIASRESKDLWKAEALWKRGIAFRELGDYPASINDLFGAREIYEREKDSTMLTKVYNSLGALYAYQNQYEQAKDYFGKSLAIAEQNEISTSHADALLNLAAVSELMQNLELTFAYNKKALRIYDALGNDEGMAYIYGNMGTYYSRLEVNKQDSALLMYQKSYEILKKGNDKKGAANILQGLGQTYLKMKNSVLARRYCKEALDAAEESGFLMIKMSACKCLFTQYENDGNYREALKYYKEFIATRDSLENDNTLRETTKREMQFEFDKIKYADSLKKAEEDRLLNLQHEQEIQQQTLYTYAGVGGFVLMLGFAFVLLRGYREKKKSNLELEKRNSIITEQKLIVDEKNKEIVDSIQYAKRLQNAILPPLHLFRKYLPDSFILYKPKDIVAGDFYWFEINDLVFLAAADCTGHGVPGAMVSVVCSNALNRAVKEFGLKDPGKILDKVTILVEETFSKSEGEVKDGMDVSLCAIDLANKKLLWSGANNPLWIVNNDGLHEIKADKQPVGYFAGRKPFTTHVSELKAGDTVYLFTDGLPDQFGGENGKKFKYSKFKELLLSVHNNSMDEQMKIISTAFEDWKGNLEQVDDVCVVGVRIMH